MKENKAAASSMALDTREAAGFYCPIISGGQLRYCVASDCMAWVCSPDENLITGHCAIIFPGVVSYE